MSERRRYEQHEIEEVVAEAKVNGWFELDGHHRHRRLAHPRGGRVTISRSPSDSRFAGRKVGAQLRRAESEWEV